MWISYFILQAWPALHDDPSTETNSTTNQNSKQKLNQPGDVSVGDLYPHDPGTRLEIWSFRDFLRLVDSIPNEG